MGNICRSPSAQGVFEELIKQNGLSDKYDVDSAGTHSYHVGALPDSRSMEFAIHRGVDLSQQRARQVTEKDFSDFDYLIAMDTENYFNLNKICPSHNRHKIKKMMNFAPNTGYKDVPDPYYGGEDGFELVLDLLEQASQNLLEFLESKP